MSSIVTSLMDSYSDLMSRSDRRLSHLPLINSPVPITLIILVYVYFVTRLGPRLMKERAAAFQIDGIVMIYNLLMVALSLRQFIYSGIHGWFGRYSWRCQPVDYSNDPDAVAMAYCAYLYYISKIVELLDTIFFVLRKKFKQITTLHVTHHAGMAFLMYWGVKYFPGGHGSFQGFINSGVHTLMYTYYLLSGLGDTVKRYLWWKKYLTQIQMAQFILILAHTSQLYYTDCGFPRWVLYPFTVVLLYFIAMFTRFYLTSYWRSSAVKCHVNNVDAMLAEQFTYVEQFKNQLHQDVLHRRGQSDQRDCQVSKKL